MTLLEEKKGNVASRERGHAERGGNDYLLRALRDFVAPSAFLLTAQTKGE